MAVVLDARLNSTGHCTPIPFRDNREYLPDIYDDNYSYFTRCDLLQFEQQRRRERWLIDDCQQGVGEFDDNIRFKIRIEM